MSQEPQPSTSAMEGKREFKYIHRKGGTILLHAGYQLTKKSTYKSGATVWECHIRKKTKCAGTIKIQVSFS